MASLRRRPTDEKFVLGAFDSHADCARHQVAPHAQTDVVGFGPYPDWGANLNMRVQSIPEAGGMMEGEHAFILDEQFLFLATAAQPRPMGPIHEAR
jgi:hypothetical protein